MAMKPSSSSFQSAMRSSARLAVALSLAALGTLPAACGGGGDDGGGNGDPTVWHFRGINVIEDAPKVQFTVDDTAVEEANYGAATEYHPAPTGTRELSLAIEKPSDLSSGSSGFTDIGTSESFDFQGPTDYTLVAAGTVADPRQFLITGTSREDVPDNKVNYQVINAAVATGRLTVLITAPEAGIDAPDAVGTLDLGESSNAANLTLEKASGANEDAPRAVRITIEVRVGATTIYESSALSFSEQSRLLFVVADNAGPPGASALKVFVVGGTAPGDAGVMFDSGDDAELRFANLSPDAGPLDLIVGTNAADKFASNIAFGEQSPYNGIGRGTHDSVATPAGNAGSFLFVNNLSLAADRSYTLYAQGNLASIRGLLFNDDRRSIANAGRFRFLHVAPSQGDGALDVYVRQEGSEFDLRATDPPSPSVSALGYRSLSTSFALKAGTYDVYLAKAGKKSTVLGPVPLVLSAGGVDTVALVDSPGGDLTLLTVDDARP